MGIKNIIGQERVTRLLRRIINTKKQLSLLFVGSPGVGKRTTALLWAQDINCETNSGDACGVCFNCRAIAKLGHPDIRIIFPIRLPQQEKTPERVVGEMMKFANEFGLDNPHPVVSPNHEISIHAIRWIIMETAKPPLKARVRIFIILHADQMSVDAQNAFLKTLETPPPRTIFILTTSNQELLLPTIRSRCRVIPFAHISQEEITSYLKNKTDAEAHDIDFAAALADGSLGKAMTIIKNPGNFLFSPVLNLLMGKDSGNTISEFVAQLDRDLLLPAINTAIFVYRNNLRAKIGLPHIPQFICPHIVEFTISDIKQKIQFLNGMLQLLHYNTNPAITSYYLASNLIL